MILRWCIAVALLLGVASSAHARCPAANWSVLPFYKNDSYAAAAPVGPGWHPTGSAFSSATLEPPWESFGAANGHVCQALFKAVFRPDSPYPADQNYIGVGLFACPWLSDAAHQEFSTTCRTIVYFAGNDNSIPCGQDPDNTYRGGPIPCGADITNDFNTLIDEAGSLYHSLVIGTWGNGKNGPALYD